VPDWAIGERDPLEVCRARVHFWLVAYPDLAAAIRDGCAIDAGEGGGVGGPDDMTWWERYVTTKADLDMALKCCTKRQQEAVKAKFHTGLSYREAARELRQPKTNVHRWCTEAITVMAEKLAGKWDKTGG